MHRRRKVIDFTKYHDKYQKSATNGKILANAHETGKTLGGSDRYLKLQCIISPLTSYKRPRLPYRSIAIGCVQLAHRSGLSEHPSEHRFTSVGQVPAVSVSSRLAPSGRPRITTTARDHYIQVLHLRHRAATAMNTAGRIPRLRRVSAQTTRNHLQGAA